MGAARARARPRPRSRRPSRSSRSPTATSACAATSTRASRTACPGTYLNGFYETRPLPYAEAGYGYPEAGQTVVNVTNGKIIRLLVDDEPFDVRYGELLRHERVLDLRAGVLRREVEWRSPTGSAVRVTLARGSSRSPSARSPRSATRSSRSTGRCASSCSPSSSPTSRCPRRPRTRAPRPRCARRSRPRSTPRTSCAPRSSTSRARSGLRMAAAMDHVVDGPGGHGHRRPRAATTSAASRSPPTSSPAAAARRQVPRLRLVERALAAVAARPGRRRARRGAQDGLGRPGHGAARVPRRLLGARRRRARRRPELQQAVRFAIFHTLQAGARAEQRAIPAKGLTGPGYDGHAFWDTETFVLPVLTYTVPDAAADALRWRCVDARPRARARPDAGPARAPRSRGARSAARSAPATGRPAPPRSTSTPTSPTRSSATSRRRATRSSSARSASSCWSRPRGCGARSATTTPRARFRIDGVTGPDEYTALVDNNVYTNLMAQRNLRAAADVVRAPPRRGRGARRRRRGGGVAGATPPTAMAIPYDDALDVHPQAEDFTRTGAVGLRATPPEDQYPLLLHFPYFDLYRKQVVKQADLVLAMHVPRRRVHARSRRRATSPTTRR